MNHRARGVYRWRHMAPFWHQLAVLLRSGLALHQALPLAGSGSTTTVARWSTALGEACSQGSSLEEALRQRQAPELTCALIAAGEHCGQLPEICDHLAGLNEALLAGRRDLINRLLYPMLVLHAALILPAVPTAFLEGPLWRMALGPLILWALLGLTWAVWRLIGHRSAARLALVPPLSVLARPFIARQLCLVLAAAAEAGMLHDQALLLAATACGNRIIAARLRTTAQAMTAGGQDAIARSLNQLGVFDRSLIALITSGEQAGALPDALRRAAGLAGERLRQRSSWAIRLMVAMVMALAIVLTIVHVISFWLDYMSQIQAVM